jgi:hypothetical protein
MTEKKISRRSSKRPEKKPEPPLYPRVFETFLPIGNYEVARMSNTSPTAMNGDVRIRRYEVTIRRIEEPVEVLRDRLLTLWRTSEHNHHLWHPMWNAARDLGIQEPKEFLKLDEQGRDHKGKVGW